MRLPSFHWLRSPRALVWSAVVLCSVLALAGWAAWRAGARGRNAPIVLSLDSTGPSAGVSGEQKLGTLLLLKDALEVSKGFTVVEEANLRGAAHGSAWRVVLSVKRAGADLGLDLLLMTPDGKEANIQIPSGLPRDVFSAGLVHLGVEQPQLASLLPSDPEAYWDLAGATGWRMERDPGRPLESMRRLVRQEPRCAGAWATLAVLSYWTVDREAATSEADAYARCEGYFRRAFDIVPSYPRAVDDYVGFKTDMGDPRAALEILFKALQRYPRVVHLWGALAYPARTSGLLEGAGRALKRRDDLVGFQRFERDLVENTYLYRGDWERYEECLGPGSDAQLEPSRDFYRGYIRVLRGRLGEAQGYFARAQRMRGSWVQFERLARVYELQLSGRRSDALAELRSLKADRSRLWVPDGEFTFKLAEAFGYLGEQEEAMDTAALAFAQGFGCERWYRASPLLQGIRELPRWKALDQHLRERQQLMERAFPVERFG